MLKQETKLWVELGHPVSVTVISDCNQSRTKHFCPATHPILSYGLPPKKSSIRPRSTWLEVPSVFVRGSRKNWVGIGVQHPSPGRAALLHRRRDCSPPDDVGQDKQTITLMVMEVPLAFVARLSLSAVGSSSSLLTSAMAMAMVAAARDDGIDSGSLIASAAPSQSILLTLSAEN